MSELELKNLTVGYNKKPLISDINMLVKQGKIVVIIGPNGVGKSTILRTVAGSLAPVSGNVLLDGKSLSDILPEKRAKTMSVMMTGRREAEYATCFDVVSVGRYQFTGVLGRLGSKDTEAVEEALEKVGLNSLRDVPYTNLSDGQKQRVLLARALVQEPEVMILDEPTSFLDIGYKLEFADKLKALVREKSIGVLMAMHELELVRSIADVVACVTKEGTLDRVGTPEEIFQTEYIESLFGIKSGELEKIYSFSEGSPSKKDYSEKKESSHQDTAYQKTTDKKTAFLMIQGTMSSAGKSLIAAGLCRIFKQDGFRVAPFKSQNMALNSYITEDGLEMGRAQVMQAEAAGISPCVYMNPILLKPTDHYGSQVIVNGRVLGNMLAKEYSLF